MNILCKQCNNKAEGKKSFCSEICRNKWVSDLMVKKSQKIKKKFGNSYYLKKETDEKDL